MRYVVLAALAFSLTACASSCDKTGDAVPDAAPSASADSGAERTSRCTGPTAQRSLAQVSEVGQAIIVGKEVVIGVVLDGASADGGRAQHQGVVVTDDTLSQQSIIDLGESIADAPPPRPFVGNGEAWVASHPRIIGGDGGAPKGRVLRVHKVHDRNNAIDFSRGPSASLAFDVAFAKGGVVAAWEEDVERRGVIRMARRGKGSLAISSSSTDADDPKLLALADGRVVAAWTGRRDEPVDAGREHELERPSEEREFRWAEVAFVDPDKLDPNLVKPFEDGGSPRPPFSPYRATSESGHVVAVELASSAGAPIAFVQDESAEADGVGGRVLSFSLGPSQSKDMHVVVARGVGRTLFDVLPADSGSFVSFSDVAEHQMLGSVSETGTAISEATVEPTMDLGRPLTTLPGGRVLVLKVPGANGPGSATAAELWVLGCAAKPGP